MKRWFVACFVFLGLVIGCSQEQEKTIATLEDLNRAGMRIGVPQGAASMTLSEQRFPNATIKYYGPVMDGYTAVHTKKIDAFVFDRQNMVYARRRYPELVILDEGLADEKIVVGLPKTHTALLAEVNAFITTYLADGTYDAMVQRWVKEGNLTMPSLPKPTAPTRTFTVAAEGLNEPMNFFGDNGELLGFDIEFAYRLAYALNAEIRFVTADFPGMIAAVQSGKVDMLIANLNATPERAEQILMSDPYMISDIAVTCLCTANGYVMLRVGTC